MEHTKLAKLEREYAKLNDEEKVKRLEYVLQYFVNTVTNDGLFVVEVTKNWKMYETMMKDGVE